MAIIFLSPAFAQTLVNLGTQGRNIDFSTQTFTRPISVRTASPATCQVGQLLFNPSATPGNNLFACTATNTWAQMGGNAYNFFAPLSANGNTVSLPQANNSTDGYLLHTDWSTFNAKQPAGNYLSALTGDITAIGPGSAMATLATVNSAPGVFGDGAHSVSATVNGKGLITSLSSVAISSVTLNGQSVAPGASANVNAGASTHSLALNEGAGVALGGLLLGAHQVMIGQSSADPTGKTIPDCQDSAGNHLNYAQSTDTWSCGTSSSGGGGMVYPGASGLAVFNGTGWGASLTAPSSTIVGISDSQTLTNKTIDGVSPTTMGYVDATSSIQTQLNGKQASLSFTGNGTKVLSAASFTNAPGATFCDDGNGNATHSGCSTGGSYVWSGIGNSTANLSLSVGNYTTTWTAGTGTGAGDLFSITDSVSNTGTGRLWHVSTASGSAATPWQADANGVGWQVSSSGQFASVGSTTSGSIQLNGSTSGSATISVTATGGTLNLGSTNATITPSGALTVASCTGCGGGSSGVSSFTGDGTVLSNSASTGAVAATLANAGAHTVFGNTGSSSAAPSYTSNPNVSSVVLNGSSSGSATLNVSATGGTLNLGSSNATVTSGGALTVTSCTGCGGGGGGGTTISPKFWYPNGEPGYTAGSAMALANTANAGARWTITVQSAMSLNYVWIIVSTANAGSYGSLAIYGSSVPATSVGMTNLYCQTTPFSVGTTGVIKASWSSTCTLNPGTYYVASTADTTTAQMGTYLAGTNVLDLSDATIAGVDKSGTACLSTGTGAAIAFKSTQTCSWGSSSEYMGVVALGN